MVARPSHPGAKTYPAEFFSCEAGAGHNLAEFSAKVGQQFHLAFS